MWTPHSLPIFYRVRVFCHRTNYPLYVVWSSYYVIIDSYLRLFSIILLWYSSWFPSRDSITSWLCELCFGPLFIRIATLCYLMLYCRSMFCCSAFRIPHEVVLASLFLGTLAQQNINFEDMKLSIVLKISYWSIHYHSFGFFNVRFRSKLTRFL